MDLRYQQRFDAQGQALAAALLAAEKAVQTALIAAEKAVDKANIANEKRFESVNEFRQTLSDQTATFPSRVEMGALADRVGDLATRVERMETRAQSATDTRVDNRAGGQTMVAVVGALLVAVSIAVAVISLVTR